MPLAHISYRPQQQNNFQVRMEENGRVKESGVGGKDRGWGEEENMHSVSLVKVKVKEADLYSAFIEVPYTQGAQVWITQCYLQTTPYLPLPRKHSPDGASPD